MVIVKPQLIYFKSPACVKNLTTALHLFPEKQRNSIRFSLRSFIQQMGRQRDVSGGATCYFEVSEFIEVKIPRLFTLG